MTARQLYEATLIELNKEKAPSLLLEDYNYFINKAVLNYINKRYNIYDLNQQTTDDLRVLKANTKIAMTQPEVIDLDDLTFEGAVYQANLPLDYYHLLNCICEYEVKSTYNCYDAGKKVRFAAKRLTSDMWSYVINNHYMMPTYKRPYYYIINRNTSSDLPTNPIVAADDTLNKDTKGTDGELPTSITIGGSAKSVVQKEANNRYGNASNVSIQIRYGLDNTVFKLINIYVDYLKTPQYIRLTQDQIDRTLDTSQVIEFPDYVCQEIIKELVMFILENASDPRLQTNIPVNQSIAQPAQPGQEQ